MIFLGASNLAALPYGSLKIVSYAWAVRCWQDRLPQHCYGNDQERLLDHYDDRIVLGGWLVVSAYC